VHFDVSTAYSGFNVYKKIFKRLASQAFEKLSWVLIKRKAL